MRTSFAIAMIAALAAVWAGSGQARALVPSGDTCTYSANGATYTVNIVTRGSNVPQFGFAFGTPGMTLTNAGVSGQNGNFTTAKLPANTTGAWISDTQLNGDVVATLTGNGSSTGPVVVVPSGATQSTYFDAVTCAAATSTNTGGSTAKALSFAVATHAPYSAAAHGWRLAVTIPAAGTISARQPLATAVGTHHPTPLVQAKRVALKSRGKATLLLKTTPHGDAVLAAGRALTVRMTVTVDTKDGRAAHKTLRLTLRR
jgi:hypothetical protein